jgi:hypothetical protein
VDIESQSQFQLNWSFQILIYTMRIR